MTELSGKAALSPDGRLLATAAYSDYTLRLRDARSGRELLAFPSEMTTSLQALTFPPDGRRLIRGRSDGSTLVWDVTSAYEKLEARE